MPQEADFDVGVFANRYAGDDHVHARFYMRPVLDEAASAEQGRPIHVDKEYIEILAPGNQNNIVRRPASQMDKDRFPKQYMLFRAGNEDQIIGTRLTEVPWISRALVEDLAYAKVFTVEHLAEVNDAFCINNPGMLDLKRRAKLFLENAKSAAPVTALQEENRQLKEQLDSLVQTVQEQTKLLKELKEAKK